MKECGYLTVLMYSFDVRTNSKNNNILEAVKVKNELTQYIGKTGRRMNKYILTSLECVIGP